HARQAVGILTEISEDRCVAILYQGVTETFAVELEVGQRDVRIGVQDLKPHAGHQRAGRYEALVERRVASPVLPGNERCLPHIGGEFAVALPIERARTTAQDKVTFGLVRWSFALAAAEIIDGSSVGSRVALIHEGELDEYAGRTQERRRAGMDLGDRCASTRMGRESRDARAFWIGREAGGGCAGHSCLPKLRRRACREWSS